MFSFSFFNVYGHLNWLVKSKVEPCLSFILPQFTGLIFVESIIVVSVSSSLKNIYLPIFS